MICEVCKKNRIERVISDSKKAIKKFSDKLRKEAKKCRVKVK